MNEHDNTRALLAMAVAGALSRAEEERVAAHLRGCSACSNEMNGWQSIAGDLRRLPTPQPSPRLLRATLARAEAKIVEQDEESWDGRVMIVIGAAAWLLTIASWPIVRIVSGGLQGLLVPQFHSNWITFVGFSALVWLAGGSVGVVLALRQSRERRMA